MVISNIKYRFFIWVCYYFRLKSFLLHGWRVEKKNTKTLNQFHVLNMPKKYLKARKAWKHLRREGAWGREAVRPEGAKDMKGAKAREARNLANSRYSWRIPWKWSSKCYYKTYSSFKKGFHGRIRKFYWLWYC